MSARSRPLVALVIILSAVMFLAIGVTGLMCFMAAACHEYRAMTTYGVIAVLLLVCLLGLVVWETMPQSRNKN